MERHEPCTPQISLAQCSLHGTDSTSKRNDASLKTPLWHLIPKVHSDSPLPAFLTLVHGNIETDAVGPKLQVVMENFRRRFLLKEKIRTLPAVMPMNPHFQQDNRKKMGSPSGSTPRSERMASPQRRPSRPC